MNFVKVQKSWEVGEHLVSYSVSGLFALLDFVNDVVWHFAVFSENDKAFLLSSSMMALIEQKFHYLTHKT